LIPCLNSVEQAHRFVEECGGITCALQIDSGMNRLGLEPADLEAIAPLLPRLRPGLVLSHLACADEPDHPGNAAQREVFLAACARVPGARRALRRRGDRCWERRIIST
jgi:alanine racemase